MNAQMNNTGPGQVCRKPHLVPIALLFSASLLCLGAGRVPTRVEDVIPAPVSVTDNAAPLYLEAIDMLEDVPVWNTNLAQLTAEVGSSHNRNLVDTLPHIRIPEEGNRQAIVADIQEEFIRRLDGPDISRALATIEKAVSMSQCRFDIDYSKGPNILLPHLSKLRNLGRFLSAVSQGSAEMGDTDAAWTCAAHCLQIADHLTAEPLLISQLVRIALLKMSVLRVQELTESGSPDEKQLRSIDQLLAAMENTQPWVASIHGERILFGDWIFSKTPEEIVELLGQFDTTSTETKVSAIPLAEQRAAYNRILLSLAELVDAPYSTARSQISALMQDVERMPPKTVSKVLLPAMGTYIEKTVQCRAEARVTRIGLRLVYCKEETGSYPRTLIPDVLKDIPEDQRLDPFSGQPLKYVHEGEGFLLYSIGPDGEDNHGAARKDREKSVYDIVWRMESR